MTHHVYTPLILIITLLSWGGATAQSDDCTNVIISLLPCLNFVSGNSSTPSQACCTQLGTTSRMRPECLCQVLNGGGSNLGLNLNQTQALVLTNACNIQTPPPSQCKAASPFGSPGSTANTGGGTGNGSSDAKSTRCTVLSVLFLIVFTASYVSIL